MLDAINFLLDFIFPKFCIGCDTNSVYICEACKNSKLKVIDLETCHICSKIRQNKQVHLQCLPKTRLDHVLICFEYSELVGRLLSLFKYSFYFDIASEIAVDMKMKLENSGIKYDYILPVPLSKRRHKWRGFNQAEELCKRIDPNYVNLLIKTKDTKTQVGLSREQRVSNLKGAFDTKIDLKDKTIVIVDDVMTTGSTLENCAETLKAAGARRVIGLVWTHGL